MKKKLFAVGVTKVEIERKTNKVYINIHAAKPGIIIGRGGSAIEKLKKELETMLKDERETYESFFKTFGMQLKFGIYADYGMPTDTKYNVTIESIVNLNNIINPNLIYAGTRLRINLN